MKLPFEEINRNIIVKKESSTNEAYGKRADERELSELLNNGVICINKSQGPTSHQVADYVKKILNLDKAGHGGTLDPNVTGVLPVALGDATRIMQALLKSGKEYVALMYLHKDVSEKDILNTVNKFIGRIKQIPPIKSAVKRQERTRNVYYFEVLEINGRYVLFKIGCEAGTYIRKIVDQFGRELNTGAHMHQLVRTKAGPFSDKEWYSLTDLKDAYSFHLEGNDTELRNILKPIEFAISHLPKVYVFDSAVDTICHGSQLYLTGISKFESGINKNDLVAIFTLKNELVCLGYSMFTSQEMISKNNGLAAKTSKVFMKIGAYPRNIQ